MLEAALQGIRLVTTPTSLLYMVAGVLIGTLTGALPGITGTITLALLLPLCVKLSPVPALVLLLSAHVAVEFGGSISAILINVPGTGQAVATCFDGYPMARKGEAARGIAISAMAGLVGGLLGFVALVASIPVMRQIIMALGPPEFFVMVFLALGFIALLGEKSFVKSLLAGGLGLMTAMVGLDPVTSSPRYTFGSLYLWDGIDLIAVVVGFFAFTEMMELMRRGVSLSIAEDVHFRPSLSQVWQGVRDVFIHWRTTLQCSLVGLIVGIAPGLGGTTANVMAYACAKQVSRHPEEFGRGTPEGVIGPESANNSKEGGALIPTIAFGIPGSSGMAVLLTALIMLGVVPGPEMLTKNLHITFGLAWVLALANVVSAAVGLACAAGLARFTFIPTRYLIPVVFALGTAGAYVSTENVGGVLVAAIFGLVGYAFRRFDYPKAPFIIGLVLGSAVERYLHLAVRLYGPLFFLRPTSLGMILASLGYFTWYGMRQRRRGVARG